MNAVARDEDTRFRRAFVWRDNGFEQLAVEVGQSLFGSDLVMRNLQNIVLLSAPIPNGGAAI